MPTNPQSIINLILADINAIMPNLQSLVASNRLLVGSAEEIHRTPNVPPEIFQRALDRVDRSGILIDILIELLLCKIPYSSEFLSVTSAPVDIFRLLSNASDAADTPHRTAEQIIQLEALRQILEKSSKRKTRNTGRASSKSDNNAPDPPPPLDDDVATNAHNEVDSDLPNDTLKKHKE